MKQTQYHENIEFVYQNLMIITYSLENGQHLSPFYTADTNKFFYFKLKFNWRSKSLILLII